MALLTCSDVTFSYEGIPVLTDVNFALEAGSYLCIVGENGSGKSTLVKGLLHLKNPSTDHNRRRASSKRDRLSAAADRRTKGFPGERLGSRAVRTAEPPAFPAVLHKGRQRGRAPQYGASRPPSIKETMLP